MATIKAIYVQRAGKVIKLASLIQIASYKTISFMLDLFVTIY